jgi:TRAP-type C4-dicarboxylate transport system permease small subunit
VLIDAIGRLSARIANIFLWICLAGLVAITAVVGWQVWGRYVLNDTPVWAERTSLLLVLYFSLLGAAVGVREQFHLGIVFIRDGLPAALRIPVRVGIHILIGGFGAGMVWFGSQLAAAIWTHSIATIGISESFTYFPIPLAGAAIVLFSIEHLLALFAGRADQPAGPAGSV